MTQPSKHTLVVGGGIIGAFTAWYLQQAGRQVTIVDKGKFGAGCSHANCGYISPSHVLPLPKPGQLGIGLKALFSKSGPLRIRPGFNLSLWAWLLKFGTRCNQRDMLQAGTARAAILQSSRALIQDIIEGEELAVEWKTDGLLFVFRDQHHFEHFAETDALLRKDFNVPAEAIAGDALTKMEPALKSGLAGAWHYPGDAHLRPDRLMSELKQRLQQSGVTIVENQAVQTFIRRSNGVSAVATDSGEIAADEFVVATGPLTPMLNKQLDCRIPIQPGKGYSITMPRPKLCPRYPMLLEEAHVGITPFDSGYRIGSTMEFGGYNSEINQQRLQYLRDGATEYLVDPLAEPVVEEWFGWRPMTWDGLPYIDRTPSFKNVWVAAGHNMLGLSMGTATGKLITELITEQKPHIDPHPYRIGR